MRLIDADELIELIDDDISGINPNYESVDSMIACAVALSTFRMAKQYIKALPTVEAEPIKHGRWIPVGDSLHHCSCCRHYVRRTFPRGFDYCPNCGAKMEVEEDG